MPTALQGLEVNPSILGSLNTLKVSLGALYGLLLRLGQKQVSVNQGLCPLRATFVTATLRPGGCSS